MTKQNVDITKDFQPYPVETPVELHAEEVNRLCDKLITELSGIKIRVSSICGLTACHGPAIDAELFINKAIQRLQHQKR